MKRKSLLLLAILCFLADFFLARGVFGEEPTALKTSLQVSFSADAWTDVVSGSPTKTAALQTAYDRLYFSGLFGLPLLLNATADQLVVLKKAQCEMALYMLLHLADEDRRKGLQAQGVIEAGIVKEKYKDSNLMTLPIPPFVAAILEDFSTAASEMYISAVDRDEDEEDMKL